jgi:hypothetical protein
LLYLLRFYFIALAKICNIFPIIFTYIAKKERRSAMPTTMPGRELVKKYIKENLISIADLAKMYGLSRQEATDYISGRIQTPKSNQFVLSIIKDFKI